MELWIKTPLMLWGLWEWSLSLRLCSDDHFLSVGRAKIRPSELAATDKALSKSSSLLCRHLESRSAHKNYQRGVPPIDSAAQMARQSEPPCWDAISQNLCQIQKLTEPGSELLKFSGGQLA